VTSMVAPLRDSGRNDRIVTFGSGAGISVWNVGSNTPIFTSKAMLDQPMNCAWQGDSLIVWSQSRVVMFKPDGSAAAWETELRTIPIVEVATRDDNENNPDAEGDVNVANGQVNGQINIVGNGHVIFLQGRRGVIRGPGFVRMQQRLLNVNQPQAAPAGAEQISKVAIVSDRVIVATTGGRIIALDMNDGKTIWQMRPSDRPIDRLLASDDFVVGQINDGTQIRVIALDTYSGQSVMHREFPAEGTGLVNLALASDGKLVYLLIDRVECKDLFEPGDRLAFTVQVRRSDGNGAFMGAIQPDQLVLSNGRIIAVSDEGKFIRVYSLENGKVLHPANGGGAQADGIDTSVGLQTKAVDWNVTLSAVGSRIYAIAPRSIVAYNLDKITDKWDAPPYMDDVVKTENVIGKDFLLVAAESAPANRPHLPTQFPTNLILQAYSREILERGVESGVLAYRYTVSSPAGIQSWQGVDGGVYYLTGDGKLFFLRGASS
jgi:outer membrane protein assembly factor BamB